jgi:hypothetical protein
VKAFNVSWQPYVMKPSWAVSYVNVQLKPDNIHPFLHLSPESSANDINDSKHLGVPRLNDTNFCTLHIVPLGFWCYKQDSKLYKHTLSINVMSGGHIVHHIRQTRCLKWWTWVAHHMVDCLRKLHCGTELLELWRKSV